MDQISLQNIENFSVNLNDHPLKWIFEEENNILSQEFADQIIPLNEDAARFLWTFERTQKILNTAFPTPDHFKNIVEFSSVDKTNEQVKKWLYHRGIKFDNKVFWAPDVKWAFVLTWKMVIKFANKLFFGNDEVIWDKTLNWVLFFNHNDIYFFGQDRIHNADIESETIGETRRIIEEALAKSKDYQPENRFNKNIFKR